MAGSYLIMVPFDTTFLKPMPSYILLFSAFLQFMYQTLDACDGKQARKINQSSPLGMLLDHGCDSLSSTILLLDILQGLSLGITTESITFYCLVLICFYLATWEEYHTHYCRTQIGSWGVTESQMTSITVFTISAIFGNDFLKMPIVFGYSAINLLIYGNIIIASITSMYMIYCVFTTTKEKLKALLRLIPIIEMTVSLILWKNHPLTPTYGPLIFMIHGVIFSAICSRLIICSVSRMSFGWFDFCAVLELALLIENYCVQTLPVFTSVLVFSAIVIAIYSLFVIGVVYQIANYLGISVFKVKLKQ
mmetsp:Transcript_1590/g.1551  ORF Transcript_1590/g.1551 Transcript_1590/m.1551 type:complete len:306 (-) Transcript_1590:40-957(-)